LPKDKERNGPESGGQARRKKKAAAEVGRGGEFPVRVL